jgi:hypothetical protein
MQLRLFHPLLFTHSFPHQPHRIHFLHLFPRPVPLCHHLCYPAAAIYDVFQSQALCAQVMHDAGAGAAAAAHGSESCFGLIVHSRYEEIMTVMAPWAERAPRWSRDINDGCVWRVACWVMMFVPFRFLISCLRRIAKAAVQLMKALRVIRDRMRCLCAVFLKSRSPGRCGVAAV